VLANKAKLKVIELENVEPSIKHNVGNKEKDKEWNKVNTLTQHGWNNAGFLIGYHLSASIPFPILCCDSPYDCC